jgi:hypothetical protein
MRPKSCPKRDSMKERVGASSGCPGELSASSTTCGAETVPAAVAEETTGVIVFRRTPPPPPGAHLRCKRPEAAVVFGRLKVFSGCAAMRSLIPLLRLFFAAASGDESLSGFTRNCSGVDLSNVLKVSI